MEQTIPSWKRMRFKTNKVWLATDSEGNPIIKNNKVLIKYQLDQDHEYWVHSGGVVPIESEPSPKKNPSGKVSTGGQPKIKVTKNKSLEDYASAIEKDVVCLFTDGASSGNPGPSGIGVVMRYGTHTKEISKPIGIATNNIAELEAIRIGLLEIKKTDLPVRIFTDSSYAQGVLVRGWKAKKNQNLIKSIQELIAAFSDIKLIKVKGHSGVIENERADFLATTALRSNNEF
ncbi:MAG: ribonuclease HI [Desulfobacterales bacterium]|nr:ribonuclease HI [Desulfobacterales bacterium]